MRLFFFILVFSVSGSACAESWTNAAGHAVSAELVSRKADVLTMKRSNGKTFTIHYKALSKECQSTVDKKFPEVKLTHEDIVKQRQAERLQRLQGRKKQR